MHVILGAAGHLGSAVVAELFTRGEPVLATTRTKVQARAWRAKGTHAAAIDVFDTAALRDAFRTGKRLFLLNPPAAPARDTDVEERRSLASILDAASDAKFEKIVAASTYGAQAGTHIGDLGVLYEMERELERRSLPVTIMRSAYYMSNWDAAPATAKSSGHIATFYPTGFALAMVAPHDAGAFAARLLLAEPEPGRIEFIEGPQHYTSADVAAAFEHELGRSVDAVQTPRNEWPAALHAIGFSAAAAQSFANMTALVIERRYEQPGAPHRGSTTLMKYVHDLVHGSRTPVRRETTAAGSR